LAKNKALDALVQAETQAVDARWAAVSELAVLRDYTETLYAAETWKFRRRVVARIEATYKGLDTRYVVTNISQPLRRAMAV
jgi:DDE family transposase